MLDSKSVGGSDRNGLIILTDDPPYLGSNKEIEYESELKQARVVLSKLAILKIQNKKKWILRNIDSQVRK